MFKVLLLSFYTFAFATIFNSSCSWAFTLNSSSNSNLQGWADTDVKLYVNSSNCPSNVDVPSIIAAAVAVWNNVPTSKIKVSYGGSTTSTTSSSPPTVYCETNYQSVTGADADYSPGAVSVDRSDGRVSAGVMYLNASSGLANIGGYNQTRLKIILAHEIGHMLGLGHSADPNAMMYYDASYKANLNLAQDDMDGISYLYPSNEFKDNQIAGCGTVRNPRPPTAGGRFLIYLILLMPLALYYKLRQPKWRV